MMKELSDLLLQPSSILQPPTILRMIQLLVNIGTFIIETEQGRGWQVVTVITTLEPGGYYRITAD